MNIDDITQSAINPMEQVMEEEMFDYCPICGRQRKRFCESMEDEIVDIPDLRHIKYKTYG